MDDLTLKRVYGVSRLKMAVDFSDRILTSSRRFIGHVDLDEATIKCEHPDCEGAEISYRSELRKSILEMKQKGERTSSFVIQCHGSKKDSQGRLTCGGFYVFIVEIDY